MSVQSLPDEIIYSIYEFLSKPDLLALGATSKSNKMATLANDDRFWRQEYFEFANACAVAEPVGSSFKSALASEVKKMYHFYSTSDFEAINNFLKNEPAQDKGCASFVPLSKLLGVEPKLTSSNLKIVVVGEGGVGKTCMLITMCNNSFPTEYIPTVFDNYSFTTEFGGTSVNLGLWDTAGQEDYDRLRPLSYPSTDLFVVLFSVANPSSFKAVQTRWLPELNHHCPKAPILLIGTCSDLRFSEQVAKSLKKHKEAVITRRQGEALAKKLNCISYIEIASKEFKNIHTLPNLFCKSYAYFNDPCSLGAPRDPEEALNRVKSALASRATYDQLDEFSQMYCTANPTSIEAWSSRALVLKRMGKRDQSREAYLELVKLILKKREEEAAATGGEEEEDLFKAYKKVSIVCQDAQESLMYMQKAVDMHEARIKKQADKAAVEVAARKYEIAAKRLSNLAELEEDNKKLYVRAAKLLIEFDEREAAYKLARRVTLIGSSLDLQLATFALEYAIETEKVDILDDLYGPRIVEAYISSDRFFYALYLLLLLSSTSVPAKRLVQELTGAEEDEIPNMQVEKYVDEQLMDGLNSDSSLKYLLQAISCLVAKNGAVASEAIADFVKSEEKTFDREDEANNSDEYDELAMKPTAELFLAFMKSDKFNKLVEANKVEQELVKSAISKLLEELE